jgi:hypothetical protein
MTMKTSFRRIVTLLPLLALLVVGRTPAGADHEENPRQGIEEVGFHGLGNKGFNTDIMPWVSENGGVYAATGTWGSFAVEPHLACPSQSDPTAEQSGVTILDATDPENPSIAARLATIPGAQNNDVKVDNLPTVSGNRDLLVHSLEPCGIHALMRQVPGSPLIDFATVIAESAGVDQTGFQVYDVSDPSNPARLGTWNNGGFGTHNLYVFSQGDRSFVAAVHNSFDFIGLADDIWIGVLQIVEITDPDNPTLVAEWTRTDEGIGCDARGVDNAGCFLHDVWVSEDGNIAYLANWDAGLILLDISDPANPRFLGRAQDQVQMPDDPDGWLNEEGNTHSMIPAHVDGRHLVIVGDEDFTGGGEIGVRVNSPADLARFAQATQWSGSAPVNGQTADLVYAGTGCSSVNYVGVDVEGKIALVDKFEGALPTDQCPTFLFKQKMDAAESAGAIGLVQVDTDNTPSAGDAIESGIPGLEILNEDGAPIRDAVIAETTVNATLGRGDTIDPWGFMRAVDVGAAGGIDELDDPSEWREVAQFKAPHVEDPLPEPEDVFSAHNPILGPDERVYWSWYTNGTRVLELSDAGRTLTEVAWFAPRPSDHPDDNDSDPWGVQEDNVGFWGSWPLCHPDTGDLLIFSSDLNRGIYVQRALYDDCIDRADLTVSAEDIAFSRVRGQGGGIRIEATVHNVGASSAVAVEVLFEVNDQPAGAVQVIAEIPAGDSDTASVIVPDRNLKKGNTVTVTADPNDLIDEEDETNNSASVTYR